MMTMAELDSHPNECLSKGINCRYCKVEFPKFLIQMHNEVCEARERKRE